MLTHLNAGDTSLADYNLLDMATGNINGSLGEVGGIAILIGLAYLLLTKTITWHIPTAVIASAALFSWAFGGNPLLDIFAGGLLLGAVFMATDYVTSPMTHKGQAHIRSHDRTHHYHHTPLWRISGGYVVCNTSDEQLRAAHQQILPSDDIRRKGKEGTGMKKLASTLPNMILSLGIITIASGALLGWVYSITKEPIALQAAAQQQAAIAEVAPAFDNNPEADKWETEINGVPFTVYPAYIDGKLVGAAVKGRLNERICRRDHRNVRIRG